MTTKSINDELLKIASEIKSAKTDKKPAKKTSDTIRKTWGFNPKTRVKDDGKGYKRNKSKEIPKD